MAFLPTRLIILRLLLPFPSQQASAWFNSDTTGANDKPAWYTLALGQSPDFLEIMLS